ncbi:MAG: DNA repair protein RecN [SAR324 cluster bacterium]|nr:DNA repair protein RecN [SAR324 cluster bacterium]
MLSHLKISNLATIEKVELDFKQGFSILTGETGAGKSIMIDALQLILGQRADNSLIRTGADQASLEAVFNTGHSEAIKSLLEESGIPADEEVIIRRILPRDGRQKILVNDVNLTQARLAMIGRLLVNIHGQHDNQSLLQASSHIDFLDGAGQLLQDREEVRTLFDRYEQILEEKNRLNQQLSSRNARIEELGFLQEELTSANLRVEEEEELNQEAGRLSHVERLTEIFAQVQGQLYESEGAMIDTIGSISKLFQEAATLDSGCLEIQESIENTQSLLKEIYLYATHYSSRMEADPKRLDWINERLNDLQRLKRKYKVESIEELLLLKQTSQAELEELQNLDFDLQKLTQKLEQTQKQLHQKSMELSAKRKAAAKLLDEQIIQEIHQLGMEKALFQTNINMNIHVAEGTCRYSSKGVDNVEFLLSVNPGQELKSLVKVASGGELSRIMLALKTVLTAVDTVETMIFDEVDTGISGRIAEIVGQKLRSLGKDRQALCITHLPQVAAWSDHHLVVNKDVIDGKTFTSIRELSAHEKIEELARLIGGVDITAKTMQLSREMLKSIDRKKR